MFKYLNKDEENYDWMCLALFELSWLPFSIEVTSLVLNLYHLKTESQEIELSCASGISDKSRMFFQITH